MPFHDSWLVLLNVFPQGNERWLEQLDTKFHEEFSSAKAVPWNTKHGKLAGELRTAGSVGSTAGNVAFVNIYEAG
jgi:cathepsin A (carboxypeptidase C)